jgi:hypothetical protein
MVIRWDILIDHGSRNSVDVSFFGITSRTMLTQRLKILIRIIERDRRLRSFTDVIGHGLGPRAQYWLTCFFIVEFLVWK